MAIDIYEPGKIERHHIIMNDLRDTLSFKLETKPELVNVDADKVLVAQKTDHKTADEFAFQYFHAPLYLDRFEALEFSSKNQDDLIAQKIIIAALHDQFSGLRSKAIQILNMNKEDIRNINKALRGAAIPELVKLAENDSNTMVRTSAMVTLAPLKDPSHMALFKSALNSQSYEVEAAGLRGINEIDPAEAMKAAAKFEQDNEGDLTQQIVRVYATTGGDSKWSYVYNRYVNGTLQEQIHLTEKFSEMIGRLKDTAHVKQGIEELKLMGIKYKSAGAAPYISKYLNNVKSARSQQNDQESADLAENAIKEISNAK
jgi:aminopeptidase N